MTKSEIKIIESDIETVVAISKMIPELDNPHQADEYKRRMSGKDSIILIAYWGDRIAGFKVGYDKFNDGSFYSWMGGVIPEFRNRHVATMLADHQEKWARNHGYKTIKFKTRNRHKAMLIFALSNGFSIVGFEAKDIIEEHRILLEKTL